MREITATFTINQSQEDVKGLKPTMTLSENSNMVLEISSTTNTGESYLVKMQPSITHTIFDAYILMAYVLFNWRNFPSGSVILNPNDNFLSIEVSSEKELNELYKSAIAVLENSRVIINMFYGCIMLNQLHLFKELPFSFEAQIPGIIKDRNQWQDFEYQIKEI